MKLYKLPKGILVERMNNYYLLDQTSWDSLINRKGLLQEIEQRIDGLEPIENGEAYLSGEIHAPIGLQEVWASGVTYYRSREARIEESQDAGGGDFYDRVYDADRPELFFKSQPYRVVHPGGKVRIRPDSTWDVPEPELTLFISSKGTIEGYTIGNDVSSRSIEGENPLYLPQAKTYNQSAALGPCLYVPGKPISPDTQIHLEIYRAQDLVFTGSIGVDQMKRKHTELVEYLFRELTFPFGCYLMTGTGIVPPNEFTLQSGDEIRIRIDHIGTLMNIVA